MTAHEMKTTMTINLTQEEAQFLIQVLDSVQLNGTAPQVRQVLERLDVIRTKIEAGQVRTAVEDRTK